MEQQNASPNQTNTSDIPVPLKSSNTKLIIIGILLLIVVGGGSYFLGSKSEQNKQSKMQKISPTQAANITSTIMPTQKIDVTNAPIVTQSTSEKIYVNTKYSFRIKYPQNYTYVEVPNSTYQASSDQIWFLPENSPLPPPNTGAAPPIMLTLSKDNHSIKPEYMEDYHTSPITINNIQGTRIYGTSKAGFKINDIVVRFNTFYIKGTAENTFEYNSTLEMILGSLESL